MRSHIRVGEEDETIFTRVWKLLPDKHDLKTLRESLKECPKRAIVSSVRLELLQMVSEPDTGRCTSEGTELQRRVDTRRCANKDVEPIRG